ncbi:hypothetical protein BH24ACT15_BH24ACT15_00830 [soil metagenome]
MAARLPLLAMYVRVRGQTDATKRLSKLYLGAYATSIAIWLTSLLVPERARYWLWAVAIGIEFAAPIVAARRADSPPTHEDQFANATHCSPSSCWASRS